ncbi:MAG: hypothetical protein AAFN41_13265, partial [Planctomycetota bacterium]
MTTTEARQSTAPASATNPELIQWVNELTDLLKPESVHWCDGSQAEYDQLCEQMVESGTFIKLNQEKRRFS